ncbi:MAG: hypothetical protein IPN57_09910 [Ignavibacteria bacterium]|nr:hypothetical protein [Ignavibacteria bacterium]
MKNKSQSHWILNYLKQNKSGITPLQALSMFGCLRLGARIYDLKQQGHNIETKIVRYQEKHFACYFLKNKKSS